MRGTGQSPFASVAEKRSVQFSTRFLLLIMVVFAIFAAGLAYATRIPVISDEFNSWIGRVSKAETPANSRTAQVLFVFFVYAAPLLMAMVVWSLSYLLKRFQPLREEEDDE